MYGGVIQSLLSHKGWGQVGARGLHCHYVLVCDDIHRDEPRHSIRFLHR